MGESGYRFTGDNDLAGMMGPVLAPLIATRSRFAVNARVFWAYSFIVAFYPEESSGICVKIATLPAQKTEIVAEVESLRQVTSCMHDDPGGVSAPRLRSSDTAFEFPFFVQDIAAGNGLADYRRRVQARVGDRLLAFLATMYDRLEVESVPLSRAWDINENNVDRWIGGDDEDTVPLKYRVRIKSLQDCARPLIERDGLVPIGFTHGDLNKKNIIVDKNESVTLIDWGTAGRRPLVTDLNLFLRKFHSSLVASRAMEYLRTKRSDYSVGEQLFFHHYCNVINTLTEMAKPAVERRGTKYEATESLLIKLQESLSLADAYRPVRDKV